MIHRSNSSLRLIIPAVFLLLIPSALYASQSLLVDNFNSDTAGALPTGWALAGSAAGTWAKVDAGTGANKYAHFHDDNAPGTTTNNTLYHTFTPVTSGRVTAQFDVNLGQTTAAFGTRLWCGNPVTSGSNWASAVLFEGNTAYAAGAVPGSISYQSNVSIYNVTPLARTYAANTWYTVRVEANLDAKFYKVSFGPQGDQLTEITPSGGIQFIATAGGYNVTQIMGISFYSSIKNADAPGELLIDNVNIYSDGPEQPVQANSIAQARALIRGTKVSLSNKIVTAGAANSVFYIEDDTREAGIRVRAFGSTVREGDRVDVVGRISQSSEGAVSDHCGEREILAEQVTVRGSGNLVPRPFYIRNYHIAGGWFGPMELLTNGGYEPVVKGVWPYNSWGDSGVTTFIPNDDKLPPLNNAGLLVTAMGKVIEPTVYDSPGINYDFYLDDGSIKNDGWFDTTNYTDEAFAPKGLRVRITDASILSGVQPLHYGDMVRVTGIAGAIGCSDLGRTSGRNVRVIRPRKPEDIEVIWRQPRHVTFDLQGNCLANGKPFFPIGIFIYAWDSLVRPEVLRKGFNTVIYAVTPSDLDGLQSDGLMTIPYAHDDWLAEKDHPAILAWYLDDEPEGHGITVQYERQYYERVRSTDPTRPIGTAHFLWDSLYNYRYCDDYTMSDVYPIHRQNIWAMTDHIDRLHQIHGGGFAVWPAIQCFGGTEGYDIPSPTEVRAMTYMALAHGSKGILYFSYYPSIPDTWAEVGTLVQELKQLTPFYCLPSVEPGLGNTNGSIHARLIENGNSGLIITVNVTGQAQTATFTIPGASPVLLTLPVEGGTVSVTGGSFTASFDPLAVHVYQWGPTPTMP